MSETRSTAIAGLLLTGGRSSRMGRDKASLVIEGETLAARLARLLEAVAAPVVEVGPGRSGLPFVEEEPRFAGPLVALAAGWHELVRLGHTGAVLVLACDLPLANEALVAFLADGPGSDTLIPVVDGRRQYLCARWSPRDLDTAARLAATGARAVREVPMDEACLLEVEAWSPRVDARWFADLDTPEDAAFYGIELAREGSPRCDAALGHR